MELNYPRVCLLSAMVIAGFCGFSCSNDTPQSGFTGPVAGQGGVAAAGSTSSSGPSGGTNSTTTQSCSLPPNEERRHPGVYDYKSCMDCHGDTYWGGWVYSNSAGDAWIDNATVTLKGSDGATVTMRTAQDGFFSVKPAENNIPATFTPCVSKCSSENCATKVHSSADCQTAACHGGNNRLIYLTEGGGGLQNTGGTGSTGTNCKPPASGGPRMHYPEYDGQTCATCHESSYVGGYVYDGVSSSTPVSMATVTITPANGSPVVAVTGPGGMFQFKEGFTAPYTACVSKCPNTLCSAKSTHTNTDDCAVCHIETLRVFIR